MAKAVKATPGSDAATPEGGALVTASVAEDRPARRKRKTRRGSARSPRRPAAVATPRALVEKEREALDLFFQGVAHGKRQVMVRFPTALLQKAFPKDHLLRYGGLRKKGYIRIRKRVQGENRRWGNEVTVYRTPHSSLIPAHRKQKTAVAKTIRRTTKYAAKSSAADPAAAHRVKVQLRESAVLASHMNFIGLAMQELKKVKRLEEAVRENAIRLLGFTVEYAGDGSPRLALKKK